jgi:hypothetical protein
MTRAVAGAIFAVFMSGAALAQTGADCLPSRFDVIAEV